MENRFLFLFENLFIYVNFSTEASKLRGGNCIHLAARKYFNSRLDRLLFSRSLCNWHFATTTTTGKRRCQSFNLLCALTPQSFLYRLPPNLAHRSPSHCSQIQNTFYRLPSNSLSLSPIHPFMKMKCIF